jgi:hypothetical protein
LLWVPRCVISHRRRGDYSGTRGAEGLAHAGVGSFLGGGIGVGAVVSLDDRFGRRVWVPLSIALIWSVALLVAAALAHFYRSQLVSSSGAVSSGSATLVGVNGWGVLLVAGVPLFTTMMVGGALWRRSARPGAGVFAWAVTGLLAGFNVLALMSIGAFIIPVTTSLAVACGRHQRNGARDVSHPGLAG